MAYDNDLVVATTTVVISNKRRLLQTCFMMKNASPATPRVGVDHIIIATIDAETLILHVVEPAQCHVHGATSRSTCIRVANAICVAKSMHATATVGINPRFTAPRYEESMAWRARGAGVRYGCTWRRTHTMRPRKHVDENLRKCNSPTHAESRYMNF